MIPPWFELPLTTRGTEIDPTATVGMRIFLRYCEHLRWTLMRDEALGLASLVEAGHFFVVRSQTLELRQRVGQGTPLSARTRLESAGRSTSSVLHVLHDATDGSLVARARVLGVWLGPDRQLARLPEVYKSAVRAQIAQHPDLAGPAPLSAHGDPRDDRPAAIARVQGDRLSSFFTPPRVAFHPLSLAVDAPPAPPSPPVFSHELVVPPRDLDVFSHVNAATWLAYADDARHLAAEAGVLDPAVARGYCVRAALFYAREAACHDRLRVSLAELDGPLATHHALGAWITRGDDPQPLCALRLDLAPGARTVSAPTLERQGGLP